MAKFIFSLQSILDIKLKLETQAKQTFAAAFQRLNEEEKKLSAFYERKHHYEERAVELLQGSLQIREIEENKSAIIRMDDCIQEQQRITENARTQAELAREQMTEAVKERKTYETLRERAFEEFMQAENKEESKSVDELVSYTYGQKTIQKV